MKRNQFLTLALGAALSLASCSNDDYYGGASGNEVQLTVDITKPGFMDETRTALFESSTKIGDLDCVWTENDQVIVVNNGARVGILKLMPGYEGQETGRFDGSITGLSDGNHNLTFYYLGTGKDAVGASGEQDYKFDTQAGTLASLSANDLLISENPVTVSIDGKTGYTDDMALARQFSFAHFRLVLPSGVSAAGQTVTVSGANVMNEAVLNYSKTITYKAGDINVTVLANNDFYMTLLPQSAVSPTFTVTVSGKTYKGELAQKDIDKNIFINEILSDVSMTRGWPITMTEVEDETPDFPTDPDYGDDYANEDTRNPLHKFAKYNLERKEGVTNQFTSSDTDNGALYQWGRNYGYMDDPRSHASQESKTDFINWEDAFGDLTAEGNQRYWDFYVYSKNGETYYTGTGGIALGYYYMNYDESRTYSSIEDIKEHQDKYFMDGGYDQGSYIGNLGGYLFSSCNPDYWVWSGGGDTWNERAKLCGYDQTNPCPNGWRLPTKEEFEAIAPYEAIDDESKLATLLRNHVEVRQTTDGIRYAIRWLYRSTYVEVQAIVVSSDFKQSQTSDIIWENNPNVVTRKFPFTGAIYANGGYDGIDNVDMAYPYHPGVPDAGVFSCVQIGTSGNIGSGIAGYMTEEKGYIFKFTASEKTSAKTSYLKIETTDPVTAWAIRPVMDKK